MKKKLLVMFFGLFLAFNVKATEIENMFVYSEAEIAGGLRIREVLTVKQQDDDIVLHVKYQDEDAEEFDGTLDTLFDSKVYNGTDIAALKVYLIPEDNDLSTFYSYEDFITEDFLSVEASIEYDGNYGIITIPNNSVKKKQRYYIDYTVTNVQMEHKDCAELNFTYLDEAFNYDIENVQIYTAMAYTESDVFEVWAHGTKKADVNVDNDQKIVLAQIENYKKGEHYDVRVIYDVSLFGININADKKSNLEVIDKIEKIENNKSDNRLISDILIYSFIGVCSLLFITVIIFVLYKNGILKKIKEFFIKLFSELKEKFKSGKDKSKKNIKDKKKNKKK